MTPSSIFLIDGDRGLVELTNQPYESEAILQQLLALHPGVLSGKAGTGNLLLVGREMGVPSEEGGGNRWALDHLFLDGDGIPVLVEVKRSTDSRIRREVVGQMLDYAANAVHYWPVETIREQFEDGCRERGVDAGFVVGEFLGVGVGDDGVARFWEAVATNLRAGRVRLIFVADVIPPELRRVVEFLGEQMSPAEVMAIEVRQYRNGDARAVVPNLIRAPERATSSIRTGTWDRSALLAAMAERRDATIAKVAAGIMDWAESHAPQKWWGGGRRDGSCYLGIRHAAKNLYSFSIWTYGKIEVPFQWRQADVPKELLEELAARLQAIPGIVFPEGYLSKRPTFDIGLLVDRRNLEIFYGAVEWFHSEIAKLD